MDYGPSTIDFAPAFASQANARAGFGRAGLHFYLPFNLPFDLALNLPARAQGSAPGRQACL